MIRCETSAFIFSNKPSNRSLLSANSGVIVRSITNIRHSRRRLTVWLRAGFGGSAPGSSSGSWCRTRRASSAWLRRANRGPPRSWGPSGSTRKAQGPGCSFPQLHLSVARVSVKHIWFYFYPYTLYSLFFMHILLSILFIVTLFVWLCSCLLLLWHKNFPVWHQ